MRKSFRFSLLSACPICWCWEARPSCRHPSAQAEFPRHLGTRDPQTAWQAVPSRRRYIDHGFECHILGKRNSCQSIWNSAKCEVCLLLTLQRHRRSEFLSWEESLSCPFCKWIESKTVDWSTILRRGCRRTFVAIACSSFSLGEDSHRCLEVVSLKFLTPLVRLQTKHLNRI